jgi:phospholipase C
VKRLLVVALAGVFLLGLLLGSAEIPGHRHEAHAAALRGIHKIRHVVIVMQENRSFDSYGTDGD